MGWNINDEKQLAAARRLFQTEEASSPSEHPVVTARAVKV